MTICENADPETDDDQEKARARSWARFHDELSKYVAGVVQDEVARALTEAASAQAVDASAGTTGSRRGS
jgi:hypothetical protein